MFFKENSVVDFAVSDIYDYSRSLKETREKANALYKDTVDWSNKIIEALNEVIEVGQNNLKVCEEEQACCEEQRTVAEKKITMLKNLVEELTKIIGEYDESISKAQASYSNACSQAERVRNKSAGSEEAEKARQKALAVAESNVNRCRSECASLEDKRGKLCKARDDVEAEIGKLEKICSELGFIERHLQLENERISHAIYSAERLVEKINDSMTRLERAYDKYVDGELYMCGKAVDGAIACANRALDCMSELNEKNYSSYDRITVLDLRALRQNAGDMSDAFSGLVAEFKEIYKVCDRYSELMQDNIMTESLRLMDELSAEERRTLEYIQKKAEKLNEFCDSLVKYSRVQV